MNRCIRSIRYGGSRASAGTVIPPWETGIRSIRYRGSRTLGQGARARAPMYLLHLLTLIPRRAVSLIRPGRTARPARAGVNLRARPGILARWLLETGRAVAPLVSSRAPEGGR